ncbi:MAG: acetyl-coenzyme A synthetase, partial [Magnetococcales bacterium]|nr:acetyl-coenzyme A synthetase [Magnetococcales bacterium]
MSSDKIYPVSSEVAANALITKERYAELYARSINDPEGFWGEQAESLIHWFKKWDTVLDWDFNRAHIRWFDGAQLNVSYNC